MLQPSMADCDKSMKQLREHNFPKLKRLCLANASDLMMYRRDLCALELLGMEYHRQFVRHNYEHVTIFLLLFEQQLMVHQK